MVDRALMDYVLLPKRMLGRLLDVKVWRAEGGGRSDHFLVEARLKLEGGWRSAGRMEGVRNMLKVSELNNSVKERPHRESLRGQYEVWRGGEVKSVEKEWKKFRDIVMEFNNELCGMRRVGGQRKEKSIWGMATEKREGTYDRYRPQRVVMKLAVKAAKRTADWQWEERLENDFEGNKKMFWKEVK